MSDIAQTNTDSNPVARFLTRTRGRDKLDLTDMLTYFYLGLGTLLMFGPVAWLILSSFKPEGEITAFPPRLLPYQPETIEVSGFNREGTEAEVDFADITSLSAVDLTTGIEINVAVGDDNLTTIITPDGEEITIGTDGVSITQDGREVLRRSLADAINTEIGTETDSVRVFVREDQTYAVHFPDAREIELTYTTTDEDEGAVVETIIPRESDNLPALGIFVTPETFEVIDVQRVQRALFDITLDDATSLLITDVDDNIRVRLNDLSLPTLELEFPEAEFIINEGQTISFAPDDDTAIDYQLLADGEPVELIPEAVIDLNGDVGAYTFVGATTTMTWQPGVDLTVENPVIGTYTLPFDPTAVIRVARNTGLNLFEVEQPFISYDVPLNTRTAIERVEFSFDNYTEGIESFPFLRYLWNSVFVTTTATLLTLFVNSMAAFALSKYQFPGRNAIFVVIISTLMVPLSVILVPAFLLITSLGWNNNLIGVIIPTIGTPTGVFLLRQYMLTIPDELIESARIDGASEWRIYLQIILPLSAPALAVLAIFSVMWRWNDFLWPKIVLTQSEVFTLQVGLESFQGEFNNQWHLILAMTVLSLMPITLVFAFLQKYITTGIATTGMK